MDSKDWLNFETAGTTGLASGLAGLFGGGDNPYDQAKQSWDKIPGATQPYYQPYQQAGQQALNQGQGQYNSLINDPSGMYNKFASGYHQSPGFNWQLNQGMNAANNAAAAGGMLGSPQHQQQASTMAEGLANQDFQNYMSQISGLYGKGLEGNQEINKMGFGANDQMARIWADMLSQQGQGAFAGQAAQNQSQGQNWGNIASSVGALAAFL